MHERGHGGHDESKRVSRPQGEIVLSIFEDGVPPRIHLHFTDNFGDPIAPPADETYSVQTVRSDGSRQDFSFKRGKGPYLEATSTLPEPHEFEATLTLTGPEPPLVFDVRFVEHEYQHSREHFGVTDLLLGALHLEHDHGGATHSQVAASSDLLSDARGIWAVKWSFIGLGLTALIQAAVFALSGSTGLLADTIYNFADAGTAIPLWLASTASSRPRWTAFAAPPPA